MVGFIIVHLGTMISLDDFKKQWRTLLVGIAAVVGIGVMLIVAGLIFGPRISGSTADGYAQVIDFVVAGTGALSGGTISVLIVQEAALGVGLTKHRRVPGPDRCTAGTHRLPAHLDHPAQGSGTAARRVP